MQNWTLDWFHGKISSGHFKKCYPTKITVSRKYVLISWYLDNPKLFTWYYSIKSKNEWALEFFSHTNFWEHSHNYVSPTDRIIVIAVNRSVDSSPCLLLSILFVYFIFLRLSSFNLQNIVPPFEIKYEILMN